MDLNEIKKAWTRKNGSHGSFELNAKAEQEWCEIEDEAVEWLIETAGNAERFYNTIKELEKHNDICENDPEVGRLIRKVFNENNR